MSDILDKFKSVIGIYSPEQLREKRDALSEEYDRLQKLRERIQLDLDGYTSEAYERMKSTTLAKEQDRIAHEAMSIPLDKRDELLINRGKYMFCGELMRKKSELESTLRDIDLRRIEILSELTATNDQIKRDQARRETGAV